LVFLKIKCK